MKKRGFTTIELIIVIAVIGILAAILIPVFSNVIDNANAKSALSDARNLVSQYILSVQDSDEDMPHKMVIAIYKEGDFYLYGYDLDSDGKLLISNGNPFEGYSDFKGLMDDWSFNSKRPGKIPDFTGNTKYDMEKDGAFYLVPYKDGEQVLDPPVKSTRAYADEEYLNLNDLVDESFGNPGEVLAYHGILLPGSYVTDDSPITNSSGDAPVPDNRTDYTITFAAGELAGDPNVVLPEQKTAKKGDTFIPSYFTANYLGDDWLFDSWDINEAFTVTSNVTITAQWKNAAKRTVTFQVGEDEELKLVIPSTSAFAEWDNGDELPKGTDITELVKNTTAEKAGKTFTCWVSGGATYPNGSRIILSENMTFVASYDDAKVTVTFDPNNGIDEKTVTEVVVGTPITLPKSSDYSTPSGMAFAYWTSSLATDNNHYASGAEGIKVTENVTFTANWVENEFKVVYIDEVPAKAQEAGISAFVPAEQTYTVGTASVQIGGASLNWYNVETYSISLGGAPIKEGAKLNTSTVAGGTTIYVTPNYAAMQASFKYLKGDYTLTNTLPADATYDLIDIRNGLTVSTYKMTCTQNYTFLGWIDSADPDTVLDPYEPGSTYPVTEELDGTEVRFVPSFDEESTPTREIVFKYWDYQNYNNKSDSNALFKEITWDIEVGTTINKDLFFDADDNPVNMPTNTFKVKANNGTSYNGFYCFAIESIYTPVYNGSTGTAAFTPFTVTADTADGTVIYIPTYKCIDLGGIYPFALITNATGVKNLDRGYTIVNGVEYGITFTGNYALANDITLSGSTPPIGYVGYTSMRDGQGYYFWEGVFDGLGYTINNWGFSEQNSNFVGLFALNQGTIRNLRMTVSTNNPITGMWYVGVVAGANEGNGLIENVVVTFTSSGCVMQAANTIGGITAINSATVRNCHVYATVDSPLHINAYNPGLATFSGPRDSYSIDMVGVFVGGIVGANDGGTITLCSVGGSTCNVGINTTAAALNANPDYASIGIGGIAGADVKGKIDQCWTYKAHLNRYYTSGNSQTLGALQAVGGIAGMAYGSTVQHCWARSCEITVSSAGGGIVGMLTQSGTINDCWAYIGSTTPVYSTRMGDIVAAEMVGGTCTVKNCAIWFAWYPNTIPSGATNYSELANKTPSSVGLNGTYFMADPRGPMLINNPFTTAWIF